MKRALRITQFCLPFTDHLPSLALDLLLALAPQLLLALCLAFFLLCDLLQEDLQVLASAEGKGGLT